MDKRRKIHRKPVLTYKKLSRQDKTRMKELYNSTNISVRKMAKGYGISHDAMWKWLKRLKVVIRPAKYDIPLEEVLKLYNKNTTQTKIAEMYGCSRRVIHERLKELGLR